ncbi:LytR family transcriptional regulator [Streptomyces sp. CB02923]|uniref:LCP family protein n=1 Tax=Streptomyces sp. CB02923 TaxID=1718985 RepID=UPI000938CF46|nr:LCP family protein [Streptomyces sp. CB02923]OKH97627.1 LytR family transcriptional regulator [Streptomyces sp. CB02923]
MSDSPENPSGRWGPRGAQGPADEPGARPAPLAAPPLDLTAESGATADGPRPRRRWVRRSALGLSALVLAAAGTGWLLYAKLDGNIRTDPDTRNELEKYEAERPKSEPGGAENVLLIGSDRRSGENNGRYGEDNGTQRSDTAILLHAAADRRSATAVSIPRDLMVRIPGCKRSDGKQSEPQFIQFNWAFEFAGAACTIRTVEKMTGIRVDHHMIVDFTGFKKMVDAVDGVDVCLERSVNDDEAHLRLPAGWQTLRGEEALGYVRARKTLGDGSDTQRMERQQQFLAALVNKVHSNGVLLHPGRLYPLLDAATSSLTTDEDLASLRGLYEWVRGMRSIPTAKVQFLTVPRQEYRYDPDRDELVQPDAEQLFRQLGTDRPVTVRPTTAPSSPAPGTSAAPGRARETAGTPAPGPASGSRRNSAEGASNGPAAPSATPTFRGTTAERGICR